MKRFMAAVAVLALVFASVDMSLADSKYSSSGSSRGSSGSSFGSSGSSRSSGSSFGSSSGGSKYSSSPSSGSSGSKYSSGSSYGSSTPSSGGSKYSSGSSTPSSKYSSGSSTPSSKYTSSPTPASTPSSKYSSGSTPAPSSKYTSSTPVATPAAKPSTPDRYAGSSKPTGPSATSGMSTAAKKEESRVAYEAAQYKDRGGNTVSVNHDSYTAQKVRTLPPERVQNHTVIVKNYYSPGRFPHDYDYYYSRPYVSVGGGYSSLFWWTLMDLSIQERALWLYHNQSVVNQQLYAEQMQNAQLRAEMDRLRAQNTPMVAGYVPPQFKDNPDLVLDSNYVQTAYHAQPVASSGSGFMSFIGWCAVIGLVCVGLWYVAIRRV